ncbi:glucokinase [Parahaliea maris]|uniref:Glucokinase n=1 Tax=Parahaliea maris TaxID=2716870 RepID=A0A5C8ZZC3_9GAMM|nr:glucokinase [Parahaliea maris]TXS93953.1 glucokinase [Parahaliea maris]
MSSQWNEGTRLVADIGGTNSRLALYDASRDEYRALRTYINRDHARFEDVIANWLDQLNEPPPLAACFAIAAPLEGDRVHMINMDWSFSRSELTSRFNFTTSGWINDFEGNAYALPHLRENDRQLLYPGRPGTSRRLAVVGPGTGLGGATVELIRGGYHATACEPGHMSLSPNTAEELELFRLLLARHDNIFTELLVSGPGLQRLYQSLAELRDTAPEALSPADISQRALSGEDPLCRDALVHFCNLLGSTCGDFVLATGSYGGLFLAGGILPRLVGFLENSQFLARFQHKGAMTEHLQGVPIYLITTAQPGLIGAAHAPLG